MNWNYQKRFCLENWLKKVKVVNEVGNVCILHYNPRHNVLELYNVLV